MSIEDVKATIRQGTQALDEAKGTIEKAGTSLTDATGLALATLHDSSHEHASEARHLLAEAGREIDLTLRRIGVAKEHARKYLANLG